MKKLNKINHSQTKQRIAVVRFFVVILMVVIVGKLFILQILNPQNLKEKASLMRQNKAARQAMRGDIVDRNGIKLAYSKLYYDIYIDPRYKKNSTEIIAYKLSPILKIPKSKLVRILQKERKTVLLARNVDKETYTHIKKLRLRCLDIRKKSGRDYPQGKLASHILGYVNSEANIKAGIESTAQKYLEDMPEFKNLEANAKGNIIYDYKTDPELASKPIKGKKITLTINRAIQHIAEVELKKTLLKTQAKRGSAIVLNPKNGEILAFAVLPNYDPINYRKYKQSTLKNWALSDVYPPGSTFKILTVASALELGYITEKTKIFDSGKKEIQGYVIKNYDYKKNPTPGMIGLDYLFEHSSNVGSLEIASKMNSDEFYNMLQKFNIGKKTGVDLPGESSGLLSKPPWKDIKKATIGFGYGVNVTPLQLASAVGAIANEGIWVTPHIIKYSSKDQSIHLKKKRVISKTNAKIITKLLEKSIRNSKSPAGKIPNYRVAGKTGTSKKPKNKAVGYSDDVYTSFVGYFPAENPQALVIVVIDSPKGYNVWGSTIAGPVFNEIATQVTRLLNIKPE